ncbi:hypothetical protein LEP1GSC137_2987 [Leptospira borgpetersenii str. Noumea 25]|nr:hypothetical protein LEP1GSC137_2987 [Leptospira borgpetersenii str. Noumea 25]
MRERQFVFSEIRKFSNRKRWNSDWKERKFLFLILKEKTERRKKNLLYRSDFDSKINFCYIGIYEKHTPNVHNRVFEKLIPICFIKSIIYELPNGLYCWNTLEGIFAFLFN